MGFANQREQPPRDEARCTSVERCSSRGLNGYRKRKRDGTRDTKFSEIGERGPVTRVTGSRWLTIAARCARSSMEEARVRCARAAAQRGECKGSNVIARDAHSAHRPHSSPTAWACSAVWSNENTVIHERHRTIAGSSRSMGGAGATFVVVERRSAARRQRACYARSAEELPRAAEGSITMKREIRELTRRGALAALDSWRALGCEYASIINGVPRPWDPKAVELIELEARERGVQLLSLSNDEHVRRILSALVEYVERSLTVSQAAADMRKMGTMLAPGGSA